MHEKVEHILKSRSGTLAANRAGSRQIMLFLWCRTAEITSRCSVSWTREDEVDIRPYLVNM
jgi:hypothetical protein